MDANQKIVMFQIMALVVSLGGLVLALKEGWRLNVIPIGTYLFVGGLAAAKISGVL